MLVGLSNATIQAFCDAEDGGSNDESLQHLEIGSDVIDTDEDSNEIEGWWMRTRSEFSDIEMTGLYE